MTFRLRGRSFTITPSDVLEVTRNVPPSQRDGRNKYFVTIHGHQYPIKQVLQLVSGLSRVGFTAQDAHRILSRLGSTSLRTRRRRRTAKSRPAPLAVLPRGACQPSEKQRTRTTVMSGNCS